MKRFILLGGSILGALAIAACSSDDTSSSPASSGSATAAGGSSTTTGSNTTSVGGNTTSAGGNSTTTGSNTTSVGGNATTTGTTTTGVGGGGPAALFPLAVGDTWTYVVTAVGDGAVCSPGTFDEKVDSEATMDGRDAFQVSSYCTGITGDFSFNVTSTGEVDLDYNGTWLDYIDPNLQEGHMWSYLNSTFSWHDAGSVTVPAGTFDNCWTANQVVSYTAYSTFCLGVGLVESYSKDLTGAGWDAKLMAFTVN